MSLLTSSMRLLAKYGKAAKVVVSGVLNVVAPGCGAVLELAGEALDAAQNISEASQRDRWEEELRVRLGTSAAELARLGQLLECLAGPLAVLCDKAALFADQAQDLPDIIARALAANPALSQALHGIEGIKFQFEAFQADLRRLAQNQADALPVYERMNRVADYFDELWAAGIKPREFAQQFLLLLRVQREAAAATRVGDYPAAQRALQTAVHLRPQDAGLADLSRRVTVLATRATPPAAQRPPAPACHAPAPAPTPPMARLQAGDTLDGWLLEASLGGGGWGPVFRAGRGGKTRAIKAMHPEYAADRAFIERFKKEIEALNRLPRHPNLVSVEGFGYCTERQTWYLIMEYIDGLTLEQQLAAEGAFTEAQVRKVFPDLIEGLTQAHAAGIVHRHIEPANLIFRRADQRLVLVDFGLAVAVEKIGQTQIGGTLGAFAAPEQYSGKSATQASDVFSLCAVIHYALNFEEPGLRKPHCFAPGLAPESLRQTLTAGLRPNARERLQNAGQLLAVLKDRDAVVVTVPTLPAPSTTVVACPSCRAKLVLPVNAAGQQFRCPKCGQVFGDDGPVGTTDSCAESSGLGAGDGADAGGREPILLGRVPKRSQKPSPAARLMLVGGIVAGLFVVALAVIGVFKPSSSIPGAERAQTQPAPSSAPLKEVSLPVPPSADRRDKPLRVEDLLLAAERRNGKALARAAQDLDVMGKEARRAIPKLLALLKGSPEDLTGPALDVLRQLGPMEVGHARELAGLMEESSPVRAFACAALAQLGTEAKDVEPALLDLLQKNGDTARWHDILQVLDKTGGHSTEQRELLGNKGLGHTDAGVRNLSLVALLKDFPGYPTLETLLELARSEGSPEVQVTVARGLRLRSGELTRETVERSRLLLRLTDSPKLCAIGLDVAIRLKGDAGPVVADVVQLLRSTDEQLRVKALQALRAVGRPALPELLKVFSETRGQERLQFALAVASIGTNDEKTVKQVIPTLVEALRPEEGGKELPAGSGEVIKALVAIGDPAVEPILDALEKARGRGVVLANYRKVLLNVMHDLGPKAWWGIERVRVFAGPSEIYPDVREAAARAIFAMKKK